LLFVVCCLLFVVCCLLFVVLLLVMFSFISSLLPLYGWIGVVTLLVMLLTLLVLRVGQSEETLWLPGENTFIDPNKSNKDRIPFAPISTPPSVYISLIVPAFNEKERLPLMLDDTLAYLKNRKKNNASFTFEILVVDDGSRDDTSDVVLKYAKRESVEVVRLLKLQKNRGKGGAVKRGMLTARGGYLLMVDADGATDIADMQRLEDSIRNIERDGYAVAVGSRAHLVDSDVVTKRSLFRNILMYGFHVLVQVLGVRGIKDTQCGFKLFTRKAAFALFYNLHIERWAFDVELLYRAKHLKIPMAEVPVNWREIPGSKLAPIDASIQMARDLTRIRFAYIFGIWKASKPKSS